MQSINVLSLNLNKNININKTIENYKNTYNFDLVVLSKTNLKNIDEIYSNFKEFKKYQENKRKPKVILYDSIRFSILKEYKKGKNNIIKFIDNYNNRVFFMIMIDATNIFSLYNKYVFNKTINIFEDISGDLIMPLIVDGFFNKKNLNRHLPIFKKLKLKKTQDNIVYNNKVILTNEVLSIKYYQKLDNGIIAELSID